MKMCFNNKIFIWNEDPGTARRHYKLFNYNVKLSLAGRTCLWTDMEMMSGSARSVQLMLTPLIKLYNLLYNH